MQYYFYFLPFLSVIIGYFLALNFNPENKKRLKLILAFSGAFLLALTVMHLLPEVYAEELQHHNHNHSQDHNHAISYVGIYIMVGIVFQIILEFFSKGAEHGHVHGKEKLVKLPISLFVSLCIHALLEGIPINKHHGLAIGIAIHHLPIAIILSAFFFNTGLNKKNIFMFMFVFALMTPLGTFLVENLSILTQYSTLFLGIVIGILFHISSTIIFESNEGHKFNFAKIVAIISGIVLAVFV